MGHRMLLKPLIVALVIFIGVMLHPDARADMLVIVNDKNPLDTLTLKEVKQLFLGRMRRFPNIDSDVDVLDRENSSLAHRNFYQYVVAMDLHRLKRYRARYLFSGQGRLPEIVMGQNKIIETVQQNVSAVGYIDVPPEELPDGVKVVYRQSLPQSAPGESELAAGGIIGEAGATSSESDISSRQYPRGELSK